MYDISMVKARWFADDIPDQKLALQALGVVQRHLPDHHHNAKKFTKWSHVCWEIGRSIRFRLDKREARESLRRVLVDLAEFCQDSSQSAFSRLLFELCENGQLPKQVVRMAPVQAHLPAILQHLAELQRLKELREEDMRRMDQMGY